MIPDMLLCNLTRLIICITLACLIVTWQTHACAEYNSGKLGEASGGYLTAVDMLIQLQNSKCGYVLKKQTKSLKIAVKEVMQHLNTHDQQELRSFLESKEFREMSKDNARQIENQLLSLSYDGYDEKTSCGIIATIYANTLLSATTNWEQAILDYTK